MALPSPHLEPLSRTPKGVLLDFGGVLVRTHKTPGGLDTFTTWLLDLAEARGFDYSRAAVRASVCSGLEALATWKNESSALDFPGELHPQDIVRDYLCRDLPAQAREFFASEADVVLEAMNLSLTTHRVRPGIRDLLSVLRHAEIPIAIVSNAHSGAAHRRVLDHLHLTGFTAQFYSDEVELRKPHPGLVTLAATALGLRPEDCWYVGDTLDRDAQAGRRAGAGAVILTASQHTSCPPFPVHDTPDITFDDPTHLARLLSELTGIEPESEEGPDEAQIPLPTVGPRVHRPAAPTGGALLIDHGGVISTSVTAPEKIARVMETCAPALGVEPQALYAAITEEKAAASARKKAADATFSGTGSLSETDRLDFWSVGVGAGFGPATQARLRGMAKTLSTEYGRAKSHRTPREGIRDTLETAINEGLRVVVVSNTLSGRAVRDAVASHGLAHLVHAYVCSDEYRIRKPDPALATAALTIADATGDKSWFLGDKPQNDARGAQLAGIANRVIVRGGSTSDALIDNWPADTITAVISEPGDLASLLPSTSPSRKESS